MVIDSSTFAIVLFDVILDIYKKTYSFRIVNTFHAHFVERCVKMPYEKVLTEFPSVQFLWESPLFILHFLFGSLFIVGRIWNSII